MTVGELKALLSKYPDNAQVRLLVTSLYHEESGYEELQEQDLSTDDDKSTLFIGRETE